MLNAPRPCPPAVSRRSARLLTRRGRAPKLSASAPPACRRAEAARANWQPALRPLPDAARTRAHAVGKRPACLQTRRGRAHMLSASCHLHSSSRGLGLALSRRLTQADELEYYRSGVCSHREGPMKTGGTPSGAARRASGSAARLRTYTRDPPPCPRDASCSGGAAAAAAILRRAHFGGIRLQPALCPAQRAQPPGGTSPERPAACGAPVVHLRLCKRQVAPSAPVQHPARRARAHCHCCQPATAAERTATGGPPPSPPPPRTPWRLSPIGRLQRTARATSPSAPPSLSGLQNPRPRRLPTAHS